MLVKEFENSYGVGEKEETNDLPDSIVIILSFQNGCQLWEWVDRPEVKDRWENKQTKRHR